MCRMNKPSQNKAFSLILPYSTAYIGTPRARFVYSINYKNAVFAIYLYFLCIKGLLRNFKSKEALCLYWFMRSALFCSPFVSFLTSPVMHYFFCKKSNQKNFYCFLAYRYYANINKITVNRGSPDLAGTLTHTGNSAL